MYTDTSAEIYMYVYSIALLLLQIENVNDFVEIKPRHRIVWAFSRRDPVELRRQIYRAKTSDI